MNKLLELEIVVKYLVVKYHQLSLHAPGAQAGNESSQTRTKKQFPERNSNNLIKLNAGFGSRNVPNQL